MFSLMFSLFRKSTPLVNILNINHCTYTVTALVYHCLPHIITAQLGAKRRAKKIEFLRETRLSETLSSGEKKKQSNTFVFHNVDTYVAILSFAS